MIWRSVFKRKLGAMTFGRKFARFVPALFVYINLRLKVVRLWLVFVPFLRHKTTRTFSL